MELSVGKNEFLNGFELLDSKDINKNKINTFILNINANEFDYNLLINNLVDPIIRYALSREVVKKYKEKDMEGTLVRRAHQKFRNCNKNEGELGELMLYCFLETHLGAPKIFTKLELKTAKNNYVNGSDGVHFLKLENGNYQLIFGESKMYKDLNNAVQRALNSIKEFKESENNNGEAKSGMAYEKCLICDNLLKETDEYRKEDIEFLEKIIYPSSNSNFYVDDAFGIFIGYEIYIDQEMEMLDNQEFREKVKEMVKTEINKKIEKFIEGIKERNLIGHNFYIYIVPFTDIEKNRKKILGEIINGSN